MVHLIYIFTLWLVLLNTAFCSSEDPNRIQKISISVPGPCPFCKQTSCSFEIYTEALQHFFKIHKAIDVGVLVNGKFTIKIEGPENDDKWPPDRSDDKTREVVSNLIDGISTERITP